MNEKLSSQVSDSIKYTLEDLSSEFIEELSEEELQQIVGGGRSFFGVLNDVFNGHNSAVSKTVNGLFKGKLPDRKTAERVVVPLDWQVIRGLFF